MNNLNTPNPDTDYLQNLSEDSRDLDYSTYSAAGIDTYETKPLITGSNQEVYISSTVGGSVSEVSFEDPETRNRIGTTHTRGVRGKIKEFTRVSRRNLLRKLASINRRAFRAFKGRVISVGLTYTESG